jgi:glycosyltransferase involved in cell wall biosynthesis
MPGALSDKKICFISSRSGFITSDHTVLMDWANGRLVHELSNLYGANFSLAIFSDPRQNSNHDFQITASEIYPLPFPFSYAGGIKNIFKIKDMLDRINREHDFLVIQLPFIGFPVLHRITKPSVFHVCANVLTAANNPFKYKGLSRLLSQLYANFIHNTNKNLFQKKNSLVIVNGNELGELYRAYHPQVTISSSIYGKEMIEETEIRRREENEVFGILFIGRPSKEKGFHTLIEAFINLVKEGSPVVLRLLGVKREELLKIVGENIETKYLERIEFLGFISWGERFRSIVSSSHCLVVSSVSEGTPRVLIEARALGCPVIATRIGGITTSVTDQVDGLLINPGKPEEISQAVVSLFNEKFRMQLAKNGLQTVKKYSLEAFVNLFATTIQALKSS